MSIKQKHQIGCTCCGCEFVLPKDVAWHNGINAEATCFSLHWEPGGIGPWCFAIPDPGGILNAVLLHDSDLTYRRPGTPAVNIELVLTDSDDTVPNAAYPWELLRRIDTLTFTSGAESLVYVYDEIEDAVVRADELSTDTLCCINPGTFYITTNFGARALTGGPTARVSMSGFAGSANCLSMNGTQPFATLSLTTPINDGYALIGVDGGSVGVWSRALLPPGMSANDKISISLKCNRSNRWATHFARTYNPTTEIGLWRPDWLSLATPVMAGVIQQRTGPTQREWFRLDASANPDMSNVLDASLFVHDPDLTLGSCGTIGTLDLIEEL